MIMIEIFGFLCRRKINASGCMALGYIKLVLCHVKRSRVSYYSTAVFVLMLSLLSFLIDDTSITSMFLCTGAGVTDLSPFFEYRLGCSARGQRVSMFYHDKRRSTAVNTATTM
jgi:hypothetical protein